MTDRMTPEQRHRCMAQIHSKGTKPEMKVRRWLWHHGYRYRLNVKSVPGSPDIVMRPYRTAIFVNGCFWHGHNVAVPQVNSERLIVNSSCCKIPATNRGFWVKRRTPRSRWLQKIKDEKRDTQYETHTIYYTWNLFDID